jgi:hypothetical protein
MVQVNNLKNTETWCNGAIKTKLKMQVDKNINNTTVDSGTDR